MEQYIARYYEWLENESFDEETKEELLKIQDDSEEIKDRFYKELEFGTAGLRGVVGVGTNRMNKYTVGKTTQGLANYILKNNLQDRGVAIACDSRNSSESFSKQVALILVANGIKTYRFESLRPTPELSFAIRRLKCTSGIVITASHNPCQYNGYKAYWEDGAQISSPTDKELAEEINKISDFSMIKCIDEEEVAKSNLYYEIGEEVDREYLEYLKGLCLNIDEISKEKKEIKIVYSPLYGTGYKLVGRVLKELGFEKVFFVEEQMKPDGNFPTISYPNPEDKKAFKLALELAEKVNADIVIANDPDADRVGLYVKDLKNNNYIPFNGNMIGLIISEYVISQKLKKGILPENAALIKSIVTTNMAEKICKKYKVKEFNTLIGFKNIAEKIREFELSGKYSFIVGFEESYGSLMGDEVRDKDGIAAAMIICEMAAYYKKNGKSLWDKMVEMYEEYGYYMETQLSITLEGASGAEKIKETMQKFRETHQKNIGKYKILKIKDYDSGKVKEIQKDCESKEELPKANILYYELENDCWFCVRPSGTEPKIKFYMGIKSNSFENAEKEVRELEEVVKKML